MILYTYAILDTPAEGQSFSNPYVWSISVNILVTQYVKHNSTCLRLCWFADNSKFWHPFIKWWHGGYAVFKYAGAITLEGAFNILNLHQLQNIIPEKYLMLVFGFIQAFERTECLLLNGPILSNVSQLMQPQYSPEIKNKNSPWGGLHDFFHPTPGCSSCPVSIAPF